MKKLMISVVCAILMLGTASSGYADRRGYVWTYEYMTMPKGMWEAEYYFTTEIRDTGKSDINTMKHWLELEYGITDRWDLSVYNQWKVNNKANETDSEYEGFKIRTRYRFGEKGKYIVDPLIYLEYIRNADLHKPSVIEGKLILAKDIGNVNVSYNQIFKRNLENEGKTDHEYATGINYTFLPWFRAGLESKGNYSKEKFAIGPTVAIDIGRLWVSAGAAFGLNNKTDDLQTRMLVGVPF